MAGEEPDRRTAAPISSVALIVGVTGITGISLADALRHPSAPGGPWTVYGAARRQPPEWFPVSALHEFIKLDALDSAATLRSLSPISSRVTHLFWVALAPNYADPASANAAMLSNVLGALAGGPSSRLSHVALQTGTMQYLSPLSGGRMRPSATAPFTEDSPRGDTPIFYHALEDILKSHSPRLTWTVHRPSIIFGASPRSGFNAILTLAAYALICRREGGKLVYPGNEYTWRHPCCDASDSELLAEQHIWAAAADPAAGNEAFNCTNGDVFAWRSVWEVVAEEFRVGYVAPGEKGSDRIPFDWVAKMKEKASVWDVIVEEEGLLRTTLEEIAHFGNLHVITNLEFEMVSSMRKSREFGFDRHVDTVASVKKWIGRLRDMNVIPKS
ncbi:Iridoid synthase [Apostasia shenzhenica]|uniref:Iridoid synthase n=1 Tax=Apostasia shenzhenica TaxID=1088818 RepID=A0A2H9ZZ83_9ASPA|nr:Iridoid synthase [Apostasia shenzhenica]